MHFLMPHVFQSHKEFKDWFAKPVTSMIEGEQDVNEDLISRLHGVLRPFILRRIKSEVEKQLPAKFEHIVMCKLSKRQRFLYEEFMEQQTTKSTLHSGNFLGIVNILMQLRKVCNHPDLFEARPIVSPLELDPIVYHTSSLVFRALEKDPFNTIDLSFLGLHLISHEVLSSLQSQRTFQLLPSKTQLASLFDSFIPPNFLSSRAKTPSLATQKSLLDQLILETRKATLHHNLYVSKWRSSKTPIYGWNKIQFFQFVKPLFHSVFTPFDDKTSVFHQFVLSPEERLDQLSHILLKFVCIIPVARTSTPQIYCSHPNPSTQLRLNQTCYTIQTELLSPILSKLRPIIARSQMYFPDKRLIQYDCGKLQQLAVLLRRLKLEGHKALIFTQMAKVLDILEIFLNIHGYTYLRLDGSTPITKRQALMERFNKDSKVFLFILSTRSGGIGVNLTGADTVIFYDSDWNPAMDAQVIIFFKIFLVCNQFFLFRHKIVAIELDKLVKFIFID